MTTTPVSSGTSPLTLSERLTATLADLVVGWAHPRPREALDLAERAVVDTVAVALAATGDPTVRTLFAGLGTDLQGGSATAWVGGAGGDARTCALMNGTSAHALDYDDVDDQMIGHPSTVLVPALLAVAEEQELSGAATLEAYWVGLVLCRAVAAALDIDSHYEAGWHSTGTIGTVAAAGAVARLLGLDRDRTRHALGVAGSLAAGSRQNFGTMTKPLHAGVAAANGVLAAKLAAVGFTADVEQLERPLGYLALHNAAPGERVVSCEDLADPRLNVKLHACCYYIHAAADAMLEHVGRGLRPEQVMRVVVTGPASGFAALIHHRPRTGLQGKFSMEYAMAGCLLDGALGLTTFTDDAVSRPEAQRLVERVELVASEVPPVGPPDWSWGYAVVEVELDDGRLLVTRIDKPRGHASRPVDEAALRGKFEECLSYGGLPEAPMLYEALRGLRQVASVAEVTRLLPGRGGSLR